MDSLYSSWQNLVQTVSRCVIRALQLIAGRGGGRGEGEGSRKRKLWHKLRLFLNCAQNRDVLESSAIDITKVVRLVRQASPAAPSSVVAHATAPANSVQLAGCLGSASFKSFSGY